MIVLEMNACRIKCDLCQVHGKVPDGAREIVKVILVTFITSSIAHFK
jgi:hypothetical protein